MRQSPFAFALLASLACTSANSITNPVVVYSKVEAADSVRIRVGQTIEVEGVRVLLSTVENDSRCPVDVVCVWPGDVTARLAVGLNCDACGTPALLLALHTGLEPRSGDAIGYRITLIRVLPEPRSTQVIQPSSYSAWIRMTPLTP